MEPIPDQTKSTQNDEQVEKLKITLDNPNNTYYSGQTIRGTISLNCAQKTKIRGIYFRVIGKSKCSWTEFLVRESKAAEGKETSDARYWGKEEHLNPVVYIIGSKNGSMHLCKGTTSYNFSFELKADLPSTFTGDYGKIKYNMEFVVDKPWFNDNQKIDLIIMRTVNLNHIPGTIKSFEHQEIKNYGLIESAPITLHITLPKLGYVIGEQIPLSVNVQNSSKMNVEKMKFFLYQIIEYHSQAPSKRIRTEYERLLKKDDDGVPKKTEKKFEILIDVPMTVPPTQDATVSQLIHIKYELEIEAKMSAFHKNVVTKIPITIGTVPHISPNELSHGSFRMSIAPQAPEADLTRVFSNWSLDLNSPQNQSNRSSIQSQYPMSPMVYPNLSSMPYSSPNSSAVAYPTVSFMPSPSPVNNNWSNSSRNSMPAIGFQPTAPPIDFHMANSSTPERPTSLFVPRPPSYDEACYFPGQIHPPNYPMNFTPENITNKS